MTTNQQSTEASAPAASPETSGTGVIPSYDERAAAAFGDNSTSEAAPTEAAPTEAPAVDENAQRRAERRKQVDEALARERARVDTMAQRRQSEEAIRRAEAIQRERDQLAQQLASRVDPSSLDEQGFFELAERLNVAPKKLGEWLQQRAQHPEVIAAQYAQKTIDPKLTQLEQRLEQERQERLALEQHIQQERAQQQAYARGEAMVSFASANAAQAPLTARFLEEHGAEEFLKLANSAYAGNIPGWEQHTLDVIEDNLAQLARVFAPKSATPAKPSTTPHNPGAAKPIPTTVSNTLAQSRASVVDEDTDFAKLPYDERARRVFGSM